MSKSLGTGIDPRDLIEGGPRPPVFAKSPGADPGEFPPYGADAVRWGLLAMSSGQDVRFNEEKVGQALQLTNKLWNASRLILMRVDPGARAEARPETPEDHWILSRLQRAREAVDAAIAGFEFSRASLELYDFIYAELCDWYLELVKPRLYDGDEATQATLLHVLTETVTLAHPLIPFVTEEIYGHIPGAEGLLAARVAPPQAGTIDAHAEAAVERVIAAVQAVRTWRDAADVKPSAVLPAHLHAEGYEHTAAHLARLGRLTLSPNGAPGVLAEAKTTVAIHGGVIEILPSADIDLLAADAKRDAKRRELDAEIKRAEGKLANKGFVDKAPPEVVAAERAKLADLKSELESL
jgi:valyl-tRNA synthetase